jgi:Holliday junction resolvasome RuvABC endonuclease subunit
MIVGIDYSMTSPAVCVCNGEFKFENCHFLYVTGVKKYEGVYGQVEGKLMNTWKDNVDRFSQLADMVREFIFYQWPEDTEAPSIGLEGYAMGAKGQVFNIGENTGILKYYLSYIEDWDVTTYAPSSVKKFATEKGNANKELMYEAFIKETGADLEKIFGIDINPEKIISPVSDIVDAYYIAKIHSEVAEHIEN